MQKFNIETLHILREQMEDTKEFSTVKTLCAFLLKRYEILSALLALFESHIKITFMEPL